jgi:hypothetical protein
MKKRFSKKDRQEIMNDYLNKTGRNIIVPVEFRNWLSTQPDHPMYGVLEWDEKKAALQHQLQQIRQFFSGCKIAVQYRDIPSETIDYSKAVVVEETKVIKFPSYISPIDNRAQGGGYHKFDLDNPETVSELCRQASRELNAWIKRYEGICTVKSIDIDSLNEISSSLESESVKSEAL